MWHRSGKRKQYINYIEKKSARHGSTQNLLKNAFLRSFFAFEVSKWSRNTLEHTILHQKWDIFGKLKVTWDHCCVTGPDVGSLKLYPLLLRTSFITSRLRKQRVWQRKTKVDKSVQVLFLKPNNFHTTKRLFSSRKLLLFQTVSNRLTVPDSNSFGLSFVAETNRSALTVFCSVVTLLLQPKRANFRKLFKEVLS